MIERKAYQCEHCKPRRIKYFLTKTYAKQHEINCSYNPENRTCCTCSKNQYYGGLNLCEEDNRQRTFVAYNCEFWTDEILDDLEVDI